MSTQKKIEFQDATRNDHILAKIMDYHYNDWPDKKDKLPDSVKFLNKIQNEVHVEDNLVFLNYKLTVPSSLRTYIFKLLH